MAVLAPPSHPGQLCHRCLPPPLCSHVGLPKIDGHLLLAGQGPPDLQQSNTTSLFSVILIVSCASTQSIAYMLYSKQMHQWVSAR